MKPVSNENTSAAVARIASKVLSSIPKSVPDDHIAVIMSESAYAALSSLCRGAIYRKACSVGDLQAMAASALTQKVKASPVTTNKKKRSL